MLKRLALFVALSCAGQSPPLPVGTLMRVDSVGADQVYVITGGGMEYVVIESGALPAHVVINDAIAYQLDGDKFTFADREGIPHHARIARQILIDPNLRAPTVPVIVAAPVPVSIRTVWKEVNGGARYSVRRTSDSMYAEQIVGPGETTIPVRMEARWQVDKYVGNRYWTVENCSFVQAIDFQVSAERIQGRFVSPAQGAKLDRKHCRYKKAMGSFPLLWVRE